MLFQMTESKLFLCYTNTGFQIKLHMLRNAFPDSKQKINFCLSQGILHKIHILQTRVHMNVLKCWLNEGFYIEGLDYADSSFLTSFQEMFMELMGGSYYR